MGPKSAAAVTLLKALCSGERAATPLQRPGDLPEQLSTDAVGTFFDNVGLQSPRAGAQEVEGRRQKAGGEKPAAVAGGRKLATAVGGGRRSAAAVAGGRRSAVAGARVVNS